MRVMLTCVPGLHVSLCLALNLSRWLFKSFSKNVHVGNVTVWKKLQMYVSITSMTFKKRSKKQTKKNTHINVITIRRLLFLHLYISMLYIDFMMLFIQYLPVINTFFRLLSDPISIITFNGRSFGLQNVPLPP